MILLAFSGIKVYELLFGALRVKDILLPSESFRSLITGSLSSVQAEKAQMPANTMDNILTLFIIVTY
jgi:hypothetical protein